jgi:peptide deformylase
MAKLDIITLPDPLLRRTCDPVERVDGELRRLMDDMLETMYESPGIGLAAVQVAIPRRVIVMDIAPDDEGAERDPICMVNPEIVSLSDEMRLHDEGCLSIPDFTAEIERPAKSVVRYIDRDGLPQEIVCEGLLSTVVQHEIDHTNGVLFIDYLSRLKRDMVIRKFIKAKKTEAVA